MLGFASPAQGFVVSHFLGFDLRRRRTQTLKKCWDRMLVCSSNPLAHLRQ